MKKNYILFIDSGIGGLTTLACTMKKINYNYIYFADNKNSPYGNKSKTEILEHLKAKITKLCEKYDIKIIVLACNTATTAVLDELRTIFSDKTIIGTEPSVHLAAKNGYKTILSLVTPLTKSQERYHKLCNEQNANIKTLSIASLAPLIEKYYYDNSFFIKAQLLKMCAKILKEALSYDAIVLGCTHYVFLKPFLLNLSNKKIFDGNNGVANIIEKNIAKIDLNYYKKSMVKFEFSAPKKGLTKKYKKILSQTLANSKILC